MIRDKIINLRNKKYFHICMIIIIIAVILFILGLVILKYNVEGETNMPFELTKVTIISSQEGIDKENGEYKWAFDLSQNNDIFMYIEKNKNYDKQEVIETITIDNIQIQKETEKGTINLYKPNVSDSGNMFKNSEENKIETVSYTGDMESNMQQLKIANQGGIIAFRYANDNVAELLSNDDEINHNQLLKKANVQEKDLKANLSFDITIRIQSGKEYKANLSFDVPVEGVVENGTSSIEITDFENVIFKRIKN